MNRNQLTDLLLNTVLPLLLGSLYYFPLSANASSISFGSQYIPDGLWAYAFASCLLIIWERRVKAGWLLIASATSIFYELLQYLQMVNGTADFFDLLVYHIFAGMALWSNHFFSKQFTKS